MCIYIINKCSIVIFPSTSLHFAISIRTSTWRKHWKKKDNRRDRTRAHCTLLIKGFQIRDQNRSYGNLKKRWLLLLWRFLMSATILLAYCNLLRTLVLSLGLLSLFLPFDKDHWSQIRFGKKNTKTKLKINMLYTMLCM